MLEEVKLGIKHWWIFIKRKARSYMEYRGSFLAWLIVSFSWMAVFITFWYAIFQRVPKINGWTFAGSMLMLGFVDLANLFWEVLFESYSLPRSIVYGGLDTYLVRPVSVLPALWARGADISALMNGVTASIYFYLALQEIPLINFLVAFVYALAGFAILGLIELSLASLAFWFGEVRRILNLFFNALFSQTEFPIAIYPLFWRLLFCIIIPTGLIQSIPAQVALDPTTLPRNLALLIPILVGWLIGARTLWKEGLKRYESAGG